MGGVAWAMMEDECACWACELMTEYARSYRPPPSGVLLAACCRKSRNQETTQQMWPREHDASDWRTENWDAASSAADAAKKAGLGSIKAALMRRDTRLHLDGDLDRISEYCKSYSALQGVPPVHPSARRRTESKLEEDTVDVPECVSRREPYPLWGKANTEERRSTRNRYQSDLRDLDVVRDEITTKDLNAVNHTPKDIFQCSTEYSDGFIDFPHIKKRFTGRPISALRDNLWWFSEKDMADSQKKRHDSEYMRCFKEVPKEKLKEISEDRQWSKIHNSSTTIVNGDENTLLHPTQKGPDMATVDFASEYKDKFRGLPPLEKRTQSRPRTALREVDWKVKYGDPVSNSEWKTRRWTGGVRDGTRTNESSGYNTPVPPTKRRSRLDSWEASRSAKEPIIYKETSRSLVREKITTLGSRLSTLSKSSNTANEHLKRPPFRLVVNNQDTNRLRGRSVSPSRLRWQMNAERENNSFVVLERTP